MATPGLIRFQVSFVYREFDHDGRDVLKNLVSDVFVCDDESFQRLCGNMNMLGHTFSNTLSGNYESRLG